MHEIKDNYIDNHHRSFNDPYPLVSKYFTQVISLEGKKFYALNNGWVHNIDKSVNFIYSKQFYFLRRRVHIWGDLVRIRYGKKPEDSPLSW